MMKASAWRRLNAHRDHRWAGSRISAFVDGDLPQRELRRLDAHQSICPECHRAVHTLRRMLRQLPFLRLEPSESEAVAERTAAVVAERIAAE